MNKNYNSMANDVINHLIEWLNTKQAKDAFHNREEISNHLGLSYSHFNKIVRGDAIPKDDILRKIAILTDFQRNNNSTNKITQDDDEKQKVFTEEFRKWFYQKQKKFQNQKELGDYLGLDHSTISKYLVGKNIPKGDIRLKLYELTGIESLGSKILSKKEMHKKIESNDVKSLDKNIDEILQATKTIENEISVLHQAITETKSLKIKNTEMQLYRRFARAFYQLADEIKTFKQSGVKDREKLRDMISARDVGYVSSFLKALFDEDKFSDFILFSDYKFDSMGEENE